MTKTAKYAVTFAGNEPVCIFAFVTEGRSSKLPAGAAWIEENSGWWVRNPTPAIVHAEVRRAFPPGQPQPLAIRAIADADIPTDTSYRDAWVDDGTAIIHDMPKARELLRGRIRRLRDRHFKKLDGEWTKATAQGDGAAIVAVEVKRQRWRDWPADSRIETAASIEDLKAITVV